jgi:Response regulators consisting of a CheY-like receiver domain and a winged-helix DNA-binding domain
MNAANMLKLTQFHLTQRISMQIPQILIVEDELVTRNTLKSIFEAEGYHVLEANNGDEMHHTLAISELIW